MKRFLSIAGSDSSGGAGIQADLQSAFAYDLSPISVVTALTAQSTSSVRDVLLTPPAFVEAQLDAVFSDGSFDAIKIGMLGSEGIVEAVAGKLAQYSTAPIVLDTVFLSSSGFPLLSDPGIEAVKTKLFPLCFAITPNIPEAELLLDTKIQDEVDMECCAAELAIRYAFPCVIITGGHLPGSGCADVLYADGEITWFYGEKIAGGNTHGTGCAFSSAFACGLASGLDLQTSVSRAKAYVAKRIRDSLHGSEKGL